MLLNEGRLNNMENEVLSDPFVGLGFKKVSSATVVATDDKYECDDTGIEYDDRFFVIVKGAYEGYRLVKITWDEYNSAKNKSNKPSDKYIPFKFITDAQGNDIADVKLWEAKKFKDLAEMKVNESEAVCCKCHVRAVTNEQASYVVRVLDNPNVPQDVKDQITLISKDGHICFTCQKFLYNGSRMKLKDIVSEVYKVAMAEKQEALAFEQLQKSIAMESMPKCSVCGKVLDTNNDRDNQVIDWCQNKYAKETNGELYCAMHLVKIINPKKN